MGSIQPKQRSTASEHDAEAKQPESRCADAEVHQVFHQNVTGVFGPGKSCLAHGKAGLHKEHQSRLPKGPKSC